MSMGSLMGIPIYTSEYLPKTRKEQFRFPRSKRVRIRKKWGKNPKNWREVDATNDIYVIGGSNFIRPEAFARLSVLLEKRIDG